MLPLTKIEKLCEQQLIKELGDASGKAQWGDYMKARENVFTGLLPHIQKNEPWLTDHDSSHVVNVLNNAYELLGKGACTNKDSRLALTTMELYFLVLSILFHDSGNVFGRKGHASRLEEAYSFARGDSQSLQPEKRLLFQIVESHGGTTSSGSTDTIEPLDRAAGFRGKKVDCQHIVIPDALIRRIHAHGDGDVRFQAGIQSYQPARRTARRGRVSAQDDGNPQFIIEPERFRDFIPCRRRAEGLNFLDHRSDNCWMLFA